MRAILLHPDDSVAVALNDAAKGDPVSWGSGTTEARSPIPTGHKIATTDIPRGATVRKYGQAIGIASRDVSAGEHVHLHNLGLPPDREGYEFATEADRGSRIGAETSETFDGYLRSDGRVGTRNYVAVISTVNCSATAVRAVVEEARKRLLPGRENVDGIVGLTHKNGCAAPVGGSDYRQLQRTLAGYADHPNVGGALFLGLGCEGNQAAQLVDDTGLMAIGRGAPPPIVTIQDSGGIGGAVERAVEALDQSVESANAAVRKPQSISHLKVALQCGGSDGNSGITANPALGRAMDRLVEHGGTAILSETPEIFGAEHLLTRRSISRSVGESILERVAWWRWYTGVWDADLNTNPAPGNKDGGLTTIHEKSLGAVAKGGTSPLQRVYRYAEPIEERGLVFMDTPGYDPASVTGQIAGGANLVAFTTGRGSCFGSVPAPTLKIATNTPLYGRMADDMDINAGAIIDGASLDDVAAEVFEALVAAASGRRTCSERRGAGEEEFAPWILGPVL